MQQGRGRGVQVAPSKIQGKELADIVVALRRIPENNVCFECKQGNPQWASVPLGILICLDCAGRHRRLGTHMSFVRSLSIDTWTPKQIRGMQIGGNKNAAEFFDKYGLPENSDLNKKYGHVVACAYRDRIDRLGDGKSWSDPSDEELKKYTSLDMGFSLPTSPTISPTSKSTPKADYGQSRGYSNEEYTKYSGSSSISSDDFFGRTNAFSTSQTAFRYHNSTPSNSYSQSASTSSRLTSNSVGGNVPFVGLSSNSGGKPRGRGRGARGRGRGEKPGPGKSSPLSSPLSQSATEKCAEEGYEDLDDDGWGGEWTGESSTQEQTPTTTTTTDASTSNDDIWNFSAPTKATDVSC